jgi:hypothetical protein
MQCRQRAESCEYLRDLGRILYFKNPVKYNRDSQVNGNASGKARIPSKSPPYNQ